MAGLIPYGGGFTFDNFFEDFFKPSALARTGFSGFKMDVREEEGAYLIDADLPGVAKEDVSLSLRDGTLEIAVKHEEKAEENGKNGYLYRERRFASCKRSVYLGDPDASGVSAKLENGVLCVRVPKASKIDSARSIMIE